MTSPLETTAILQQHEDASASLEAEQVQFELQIELQNAIALCSSMKSENADLKQQLSDSRAFGVANSQRHAEWREAWEKERESVLQREKSLERKEAKWKARFEERRRELEELERKHTSNVVHSGAYLDFVKDLEAGHTSKSQKLALEARKWREHSYESRRNYEELQAKYNTLQSQMERERDVGESLQKEIDLLQQSFAEHIEGEKNCSTLASESLVRELNHRVEEKELLLEQLHQEVSDMRKARDDAVCSKDELIASHQAEQQKISKECSQNEANNQALERRIQAAKKEASEAISAKAELEDSLQCTSKEMGCLRDALAVKEEGHKREIDHLRMSLLQSETKLKRQLDETNAMLVEEKAKTKDLERRLLETQEHATEQIAALAKDLKRDDNSDKLITAKDKIVRLENTHANLQKEMEHRAQSREAEVQRLKHACESTHKDLSLVLLEKNEIEKNATADRMKMAQKIQELKVLERSLLKSEQKYQMSVDESVRLSHKIEDLEHNNSSLASKVKCATGELNALKNNSTDHQDQAQSVEKYKELLSKEKRRSEAYKGKAIEAHKRSIKAKEVLDSLCTK